MEKFEQTSQDIKEFEWVKQQVKAELQSLQQNVQQELFYQKEGDKITYNLDLVKTYLEHIKDRSWSQLTEKNSSAWIMAVQIALEHQGYDVEKVDGIWWNATKAAIERFQGANELVKDGKPWTFTIQKLLEGMWSSASQAETSETPTETAETPTETSGTPTETSGTPTETTGTPTETTETSTETTGTPTETTGTPTETAEIPTETTGTPAEKPQTQTEKAGEIKEIDLSTLGTWDENGNFVFHEGVEKTDQKGKYIEIEGKKYYKYKEGMTWLGYKETNNWNWSRFEYGQFLNGKVYKQRFYYDSDGAKGNYEYDEKGNEIKRIIKNADGTIESEYNYEYDEKGNEIKRIIKNADGTIESEENYEYDEKGNKIKEIIKNADGTIKSEENYEYDEKGNKINLKREGADNNNYNVAYTYDENGNKKTEKTDHIVGITTERDYDENEKITKEKKTYHDDKPVIEWKFDDEWELIKEEVENQEDEAKESSYTGQVNAYNKQKHGSGTTTFKNKQTEGGYYEKGKLLIWGEKNEDNYAQQRGTVKLKEVYKVDKEKKRYQERTVESWGNTITLLDTASGYTFSTRSGAKLTLPKDLWRKKALNAANLINAAVGIVKQSGNELDYFEADGNRLEADYKVSASNLRYGLQDATLIKNVNEKFWVSAKELAAWLNEYRKELGI